MIAIVATQHIFKDKQHYYQLSLGLGDCRVNSFNTTRILEFDRGYVADNSHPTIRRFKGMVKVAECHLPESRDSHYFPQHAMYFNTYLKKVSAVPSDQLERLKDMVEFDFDIPVETLFWNFAKNFKYEVVPHVQDFVLIQDNSAFEQSSVFTGRLPSDPENNVWDLRITKVCDKSHTVIIDVFPLKQLATFDKIRSTFMFKMDKMEPKKTKLVWETEWVSNLNPEIAAAFLEKKKEFMAKFKD
mmetsp:Transcript_22147/g.16531  ORF Transcript_22147/g.16531 Transcript_22147/m.16531 type:complete len:243 (+) Transcript_22147:2412-3140(+)